MRFSNGIIDKSNDILIVVYNIIKNGIIDKSNDIIVVYNNKKKMSKKDNPHMSHRPHVSHPYMPRHVTNVFSQNQ